MQPSTDDVKQENESWTQEFELRRKKFLEETSDEERAYEVRLETISKRLEAMPNNPVKIFNEFGLPIVEIDGVTKAGKGYRTTYLFNDKEYKRPELVAKAYYEMQGAKVTWSEGVAWEIASRALVYEIVARCGGMFASTLNELYTKDEAAQDLYIKQIRFEGNNHHGPLMDVETLVKVHEINASKSRLGLRGEPKGFNPSVLRHVNNALRYGPRSVAAHMNNEVGTSGIQFVSTPEVFCEEVQSALNDVANSCSVDELAKYFPRLGDRLSNDFRDKYNLTEWTLLFARELLDSFDRRQMVDIFSKCHSVSCSLDLTVVDLANQSVKFSEVKVEDKFTDWQLQKLPNWIAAGLNLELCVIR